MGEALQAWLVAQQARSRERMLASISRTDLVKVRPGFGQRVRAAPGSVLASPVLADWDPEPDYFFHWFRDSALVMDALCVLHEQRQCGDEALAMLADFIAFSSALDEMAAPAPGQYALWRDRTQEDFRRYLRDEAELASACGADAVAGTRVNADGTPDISKWARPQHDGAALRALALLRWRRRLREDDTLQPALSRLLRHDLAFVLSHWDRPAFDMWEERRGLHYHTLRVSAAALSAGASWHGWAGDPSAARACREAARQILARLDTFWLADAGFYASTAPAPGVVPDARLDISVVFAAIHARGEGTDRHAAGDPRVQATLQRLVELFAGEYAINAGRHDAPAMGRYRGDRYFSGGAYFFSTFAAAELCFRAATAGDGTGTGAAAWCRRGDAFLATMQAFAPPDGSLPEQFDQRTGRPASARDLAWNHAAFITCLAARREALAACAVRCGRDAP